MKNISKWATIMFVIGLLFTGSTQATPNNYSPPTSEITYQQFYNDLSPYGNWINDPQYGFVWSPYESGFQPYRSNGNWAYTNYGWTWISGYNWGWAPFHYGRWTMDPYYGWLWIPGYEWAPAWVNWRSGGNYYGWAPMGPGYGYNMSINIWNFVPSRYIYSRRLHDYYVNPSRNVTIINNTTIINNNIVNNGNTGPRRTYNTGPSVREVERATKTRVRQLDVVQSGRPGAPSRDADVVRLYKPEVEKTGNKSLNIRPVRAIELNDLQKEEVLAVRKETLEKSDLNPVVNNNQSRATRSLNDANKSLNEISKRENATSFQDNGIKNSSLSRTQSDNTRPGLNRAPERREIQNVNPELNNNIPSGELNASPERLPRSQRINTVTRDMPEINSVIENRPAPLEERGLRQTREIPSANREVYSREMPQARQDVQVLEPAQARDMPIRRVARETEIPSVDREVFSREIPQSRQEAPVRQPVRTREMPARNVAPDREAPSRNESIRSVPSRQYNSAREEGLPNRSIRRG
ncbi:MAG: DUF6600 domain-containing protein [Ginsengibacter sp.]